MYRLLADTTSYLVTRNNKKVLRYTFDGYDYHPHCHPVRTPNGDIITAFRPGDHPWHEGMYFSWKYLNGHNVWDQDFHDPIWGVVKHISIEPSEDCGESAGIRHRIRYITREGAPLLDETRTIIIGSISEEDAYSIDWEIESTPLVDELVFERKPEWGGYAGMHTRLVRCINPNIRNSNGEENIEEDNEDLANWMDYSFWVDGKPSRTHFEFWNGTTMMSHPSNFRHPSPFRGYYAKNIHSLHAPILRDEPFSLKKGETVKLRYRNMIYDGQMPVERINRWWKMFSQCPKITV